MTISNLNYFCSTIQEGNMNTNSAFYKEGMTKEEIRIDFTLRRIALGKTVGFDGLKVVTPIQKARPDFTATFQNKSSEEQENIMKKYNSKYQDGYSVRVTSDMIQEYNDLYDLDIYADILMIGKDLPRVALAYPVADCPVVFAEDTKNKVVAMAHCGGEYIDRELPSQLIDALRNETDVKKEDILVHVTPHAQAESFTYDCIPRWMEHTNLWEDATYMENDLLHIDMKSAICKQLYKQGISASNIYISNIDTITDPRFYSNSAGRFHLEKRGRFYAGCFYNEELESNCQLKLRK